MRLTTLALLIYSFHSFFLSFLAQAQSFVSGAAFTAVPIYGELKVQCQDLYGNLKTSHFQCEDLHLNPVEYDFFVGPKVDADTVSLSSSYLSGKGIQKNSPYHNGSSTSRFNLWVHTLFQQPLLSEGKNVISFSLKKQGQDVLSGEFEVDVQTGQAHKCPRGSIFTENPTICDSPYTACQEYFQQYNYCQ